MTQNTIANVLTDLNVFNSNKNWVEVSFILYEIGFYELPNLKEAQNMIRKSLKAIRAQRAEFICRVCSTVYLSSTDKSLATRQSEIDVSTCGRYVIPSNSNILIVNEKSRG